MDTPVTLKKYMGNIDRHQAIKRDTKRQSMQIGRDVIILCHAT